MQIFRLVFHICVLLSLLLETSRRPEAIEQPWLIVIKAIIAVAISFGLYALDIRITPKVIAKQNTKKKMLLSASFIIPYLIVMSLYVLFCYYVI
jgi:uncharacterized Fe-S cluster-containing MiaB family protein